MTQKTLLQQQQQQQQQLQLQQTAPDPDLQQPPDPDGRQGRGRSRWTGGPRPDTRRRDAPPARTRRRTPGEDVRFYRKMLNHMMEQNEQLRCNQWIPDQGNE